MYRFVLIVGIACLASSAARATSSIYLHNKQAIYNIYASNTVELPSGSDRVVQFPMITGGIKGNTGNRYEASYESQRTTWFSCGSLSSIRGRGCTLLGVFLDDGLPATKPPSLDFSTQEAMGFTSIEPLIGQVFFIGDGHVGYNDIGPYDSVVDTPMQQFIAPDSATRLVLGMVDSPFYDNAGRGLTVTYEFSELSTIPEPATLIAGLAGLAGLRRYVRWR